MRIKKICCLVWIVLCSLLLAAVVSSKNHGIPANDLVDIINKNRSATKLPQLSNSPGLGCMALQYVEQCKGNCSSNNTVTCQPSEDDFTEVLHPIVESSFPLLAPYLAILWFVNTNILSHQKPFHV